MALVHLKASGPAAETSFVFTLTPGHSSRGRSVGVLSSSRSNSGNEIGPRVEQ